MNLKTYPIETITKTFSLIASLASGSFARIGMGLKKDNNPLRIFAVVIAFSAVGILFLYFYRHWEIAKVFNLVGILTNTAGGIWAASGVYLAKAERRHLESLKPSRNKSVTKLAQSLISSSDTVMLSLLCICVGNLFQAAALFAVNMNY